MNSLSPNPRSLNPLSVLLRGLIRAYQWTVAPILGVNCRYAPSCSEYACEAIDRHGALAGTYLAGKRLLRCHPWGGFGYDPVPEHAPFRFGAHRADKFYGAHRGDKFLGAHRGVKCFGAHRAGACSATSPVEPVR